MRILRRIKVKLRNI